MNKNLKLNKICFKLEKYKPVSAFLYGSRARKDYHKNSDFEIGVLFSEKEYLSRSKLAVIFKEYKNYNIYPFVFEKFIKGEIDSPFVKNIYLREITQEGKTIFGEEIIENINPPKIYTIDIVQELRFNIGKSLDSIICEREGCNKITSSFFSKSCLFGTRDLIILKQKFFPVSYDEIFKLSNQLDLGVYNKIVNVAYKIRKNGKYSKNDLFQNISYLNSFVEKEILNSYKKDGNKVLIE
ncbi:MAG: nucleotidyltransferase domain-containing protein [Candidatus Pacebacteria bacterium]|nr:nucleotidyltransferase domain-containing protein [Candidatus Paceibacterota bacterium]